MTARPTMAKLPSCDCEPCRAAVKKLSEPVRLMSIAEATAWNRAYADKRRRYRDEHPAVSRQEIEAAEGML